MVDKIIAELREQGADDTQILESLQKMADEGKITPDEFEEAKKLLHGEVEYDANAEKEEASRLFGMKLM